MAQRVYFNYQQALGSYEFGREKLGILFPGRYCGFDTKAYTGLTLALTHAASGIVQTDASGTQTAKTGSYMTPQGSVIQEDAQVTIGAVASNTSGNPRIDLITAEYIKPVSGSTAATYQVVTGTPGAIPVAPALPSAFKRVILGYLLVPTGTTVDLSTCTFTPATTPLIGNEARPVYYTDYQVNCANNWAFINDISSGLVINIRKNEVTKNSTMVIQGDLTNATAASQTICTLPTQLRPLQNLYIPIISTKNDNTTETSSILKITTAGVVTLITPANATDVLVRSRGIVISLD